MSTSMLCDERGGQRAGTNEIQRDDATIKQSGRAEMRQGTEDNDKARRDAMTRRCSDLTTTRREG